MNRNGKNGHGKAEDVFQPVSNEVAEMEPEVQVQEVTEKATETPVAEAPKVEAPVAAPAPEAKKLSLEEKIAKVEDLTTLIAKFRSLSEAKRKLTTFKLGSDTMTSKLTLTDSNNNEFKTSNSTVIAACLDAMKEILDGKISEAEAQIEL